MLILVNSKQRAAQRPGNQAGHEQRRAKRQDHFPPVLCVLNRLQRNEGTTIVAELCGRETRDFSIGQIGPDQRPPGVSEEQNRRRDQESSRHRKTSVRAPARTRLRGSSRAKTVNRRGETDLGRRRRQQRRHGGPREENHGNTRSATRSVRQCQRTQKSGDHENARTRGAGVARLRGDGLPVQIRPWRHTTTGLRG